MEVDFAAEGLLDGLEDERERTARLQLLERLHREGVPLEELREAAAQQRLALAPVERVLNPGPPRYTREELAQLSGLDLEFLGRLWRAMGMAEVGSGDRVFSEADAEAARLVRRALDAGMPEEGMLDIVRVASQSMARIAAAVGGVFAQSFIRPGDTELDLALRYEEAVREVAPVTVPLLNHVFLLHQLQVLRQATLGGAALAEGRLGGAREIAVCFADLVGFTRLGERVPASELGAVAGRLGDLAAEVATEPVRLVKMIGDAAMLVSFEPPALLHAVLSLVDLADAQGEDFPQLRAGIAAGEALGRGGDWYGRPVNIASRVCGHARPGTALATAEVRDRAPDGFRWSLVGRRRLKGVREPVTLYRVRRAEPD